MTYEPANPGMHIELLDNTSSDRIGYLDASYPPTVGSIFDLDGHHAQVHSVQWALRSDDSAETYTIYVRLQLTSSLIYWEQRQAQAAGRE